MPTIKKHGNHPPSEIRVAGATAADGTRYIHIAASGRETWIPRDAFTAAGGEALRMLKARGIAPIGAEWVTCKKLVTELVQYPAKTLIRQCGWDPSYNFALADASAIPSTSDEQPVVLFQGDAQKCATRGTMAEWRKITALLKDQPVATFAMLAAFAGPFLSLTDFTTNPGFEFAGPGAVGMNTMQQVAAAVCGPADNPHGSNYGTTAIATINGLEGVMSAHRDMTLIMGGAGFFASCDHLGKRAAKFNALVLALAEGTEKPRFDRDQSQRSRFVFMTWMIEPLAELLVGHRVAVAEAAGEKLLTMPITADRPYGIFDCLPEGRANIGSLAAELSRRIKECHGIGIRRLLRCLVADLAKDPEAVVARVGELMEFFRQEAGVDRSNGSEIRAADAYGLIYAASMFAVKYWAVSRKLDPLKATLTCFQLYRAAHAKPLEPLQQLMKLADDWDRLDVKFDRLVELSDADIDAHSAILFEARNGRKELLLTKRQLDRAFANTSRFLHDPAIRQIMIHEIDRGGTKRRVRKNREPERFYCFRMPEAT